MDSIPANIVLVCDDWGIIQYIIRDDIGFKQLTQGQSFGRLVDSSSRTKLLNFMVELFNQGTVYDWEINLLHENRVILMYISGVFDIDRLKIVFTNTPHSATNLFKEILETQNALVAILPTAIEGRTQTNPGQKKMNGSIMDKNAGLQSLNPGVSFLNREFDLRLNERTAELANANQLLLEKVTQLEQSLQSQQELFLNYQIVADNTFDWEHWLDPQGRFIYSSPSCLRITGHDREEFIQDSTLLERIIYPDDLPIWQEHFNEDTGEVAGRQIEFRIRHADGTIRWISHSCQPIFNSLGNYLGRPGSNRDVSKRKDAENQRAVALDALRESETRFQQLFDHMAEGVAIYRAVEDGQDFVLVEINKTGLTLSQVIFSEVIGKKITDVFPAIEQIGLLDAFRSVWKTGQPKYHPVSEYTDGRITQWVENYIFKLPSGLIVEIYSDTSEKRKVEMSLHESEEKYRTLFENKHTAMLLIDPNTGQIVDANPAACAFYGYTREELSQVRISQLNVLPEEMIKAEMEQARLEKRSYFNFKHRLAYGEIRNVEVFSGPIILDNKQLLFSVIHDDNERKKAEDALKISEEKYRILFEDAIEGIVQSTPQGQYINVNQSLARIFGYDSAEEMIGRVTNAGVQIYAHPEDRIRMLDLLASSDRVENFEAEGICKDGSSIWCSFNVNAIRNAQGEIIRLDSRLVDITQRRLAEISLHQKTEELDRFFNIALDLLCIADTDGYFRRLNQAWETTLGYPLAELEGSLFLNYVHPDDRQGTLDSIAELSEQKPVINFINRYRCKDGTYRWIEWRTAPFGKQIYAAARDITAHKEVEEKLHNAQADLEMRVRERTSQLEAANHELEAFSYSISHDLRTPLRALDGFSGILLADYQDKLDEQARDYLIRIRKASRHMWQLTEDLLALAHITRMPYASRKVDLSTLARQTAAEIQSLDPQRKVNIEIAPDMVAWGDPNLLKIVYENLLNNAYKFTGQIEQAQIQIGVVQQAGETLYFVRDNGSGFDMAYAGKLFTPFQRLHNKDEFPGTGIGLVTVKRIITRHGGRIWPVAQLNRGATFYFTLGESQQINE